MFSREDYNKMRRYEAIYQIEKKLSTGQKPNPNRWGEYIPLTKKEITRLKYRLKQINQPTNTK